MTTEEALDAVEARIRAQVAEETQFSAPWLMGMACVSHVESVRIEAGLR